MASVSGWRPEEAGRSCGPGGSRGGVACPSEAPVSRRPVGRIRHRAVFAALRRPAGRAQSGPVRVSWVPDGLDEPFPQVSYAIGRKHGGAVQRNRLRRRLREAVARSELPPGAYLVAAEPSAQTLGFAELVAAVGSAMNSAATRGNRP